MYNEKIKEKFIDDSGYKLSKKKYCISMFDMIEELEKGWGSDLCTIQLDELNKSLWKVLGLRESTEKLRFGILHEYCRWCLKNHIENACDALLHADDGSDDRIKHSMVSNPMHLQRILDMIFEPENSNCSSLTLRAYCWCSFMGIPEDDIVDLEVSDVDIIQRTVNADNRQYQIYQEGFECLKKCAELNYFKFIHPRYEDIERQRIPGNKLLRGIRGGAPTKNTIRTLLTRAVKSSLSVTKTNLTYRTIWMSGCFYRQYERERAGYKPEFIGMAEVFMGQKEYSKDPSHPISSKKKSLANAYAVDYNRWKEAFS